MNILDFTNQVFSPAYGVQAQTGISLDFVRLGKTFLEGLLSFLAPCVLPLVPGYLSYVSGVSVSRVANRPISQAESLPAGDGTVAVAPPVTEPQQLTKLDKNRVLVTTLLFVAGFTTIFVILSVFFNFIIDTFGDIRTPMRVIGGVLVILFGLHFLGIFRIRLFNMEKRLNLNSIKPANYIGAYLLGGAFAFGWTPCVGPFLTDALFTAEQGNTLDGMWLMLVYSAGLGIPFILSGIFFSRLLGFIARVKRHFQTIEIASGLLLIVVGILLLTNNLTALTQELSRYRFF